MIEFGNISIVPNPVNAASNFKIYVEVAYFSESFSYGVNGCGYNQAKWQSADGIEEIFELDSEVKGFDLSKWSAKTWGSEFLLEYPRRTWQEVQNLTWDDFE